mgnify:CR=1 FL=1
MVSVTFLGAPRLDHSPRKSSTRGTNHYHTVNCARHTLVIHSKSFPAQSSIMMRLDQTARPPHGACTLTKTSIQPVHPKTHHNAFPPPVVTSLVTAEHCYILQPAQAVVIASGKAPHLVGASCRHCLLLWRAIYSLPFLLCRRVCCHLHVAPSQPARSRTPHHIK